jgi:thiol-disulfide isomerase/thioredoxin
MKRVFLFLLSSLFLLSGCQEDLSYRHFVHLESYEDAAVQTEEYYLVYVYRQDCPACMSIEEDVLSFAKDNLLDVKVYFIEINQVTGDSSIIIGPEGQVLSQTPTLVLFSNGQVTGFLEGTTYIQAYFINIEEQLGE